MHETAKSRFFWGELEREVLSGKGIDIGCGLDPVHGNVRCFDLEHGDANEISKYVTEQFDYVYSSHCLEHMRDPSKALIEWWKLVKLGGHLIFIVPDEDLYEQGIFPSRFNPDHKATFTISKGQSWSPVSCNVWDLAGSLPGGRLISLSLQDQGYNRSLMTHGVLHRSWTKRLFVRGFESFRRRTGVTCPWIETMISNWPPVDQTLQPNVLAQIQCIVKKTT
jgi:SAM-dependent methyltransferase